jgi:hypothetical protein
MTWLAIGLGCAGCYALKVAGVSVPTRVLTHATVQRIAALLPIAMLAALAAVQTFADGKHLQLDARVYGVGAAIVAIRFRAPFIAVVVIAAATSALVRATA